MNRIDILGYAASVSVLATFCMSTMVPLRVIAIGSNVLFATFGALAHIYPVLVLHLILLPVNIARLIQILRLTRNISAAHALDLSVHSLLPFMSRRFVNAGEVLMRKGDKADRMYYLVNGQMEVRELGKIVKSGAILGEIGIFAHDQKRMATIVCVTDCELYEMSETKAKQLYVQDRFFGLAVLQLIIGRHLENMRRLQTAPHASETRTLACTPKRGTQAWSKGKIARVGATLFNAKHKLHGGGLIDLARLRFRCAMNRQGGQTSEGGGFGLWSWTHVRAVLAAP